MATVASLPLGANVPVTATAFGGPPKIQPKVTG